MPKLHQILAVEAAVRKQAEKDLTEAHKSLQSHQLLCGLSRTYAPAKEDGEHLASESSMIQLRAPDVIRQTV